MAIDPSADRHHNALLRELVRQHSEVANVGPHQYHLDPSETQALLKFLDRCPGAEVVQQSNPGSVPTAEEV